LAKQVGALYPIALCHYGLAHTLVELGRGEEAMRELILARGAKIMPLIEFYCDSLEAAYLFNQNRHAEGSLRLRECLRRSRQTGIPHPHYYRPELMTALYVKAVEQDVEPAYVRDCIRRSWLIPTAVPSHLDTWPYPLKLHTLGRFTVARDDQPLSRSAAHKKPLALLQALVALGGRAVDEDRLAECFWPEAEGDVAIQNLKINVHRLRKLLPEDALVWTEGKLTLDAHRVWVDLWALERELNRLDQATPAKAAEQVSLAQRIFSLYRGEFLSGNNAPWALAARERIRHKLLRLVTRVAESLRPTDPATAIPLYERAIEIDPLRESLYQGIMRCHQILHRPAEVEHVYRRCRDTLRRELGLAPSPATEALRQV
jgi:DNA-binding SARP family transcriptional activator